MNIQTFTWNFACEMAVTYSNRTAFIYQTATRWDLPPYRINIWLIDGVKLVFVCLLDDLMLGFCYSNLDTGETGGLEFASTITYSLNAQPTPYRLSKTFVWVKLG